MREPARPGAARRIAAAAAATTLVTLLAGCATPPQTRFHTLMPPAVPSAPQRTAAGSVAWEVLPVGVPAQVDQAQWVVYTADGGLAVLEQERWIAPLGEEFRGAVTQRLTQILGPAAAPSASSPTWEVRIDVQRFESVPGKEARLEANWTLSSTDKARPSLRCRGAFVQAVDPTGGGYLALAKAHQRAAAELGDAIGGALKTMSAGGQGGCGG